MKRVDHAGCLFDVLFRPLDKMRTNFQGKSKFFSSQKDCFFSFTSSTERLEIGYQILEFKRSGGNEEDFYQALFYRIREQKQGRFFIFRRFLSAGFA